MSVRKTTDRLCIITRKDDGRKFSIYYDPAEMNAADVAAQIGGDIEVLDVGPQTARLIEKLDEFNWNEPSLYFLARVNAVKGELEGYVEDLKDLRTTAAEIPDLMAKTGRTIRTVESMIIFLQTAVDTARGIYDESKPD